MITLHTRPHPVSSELTTTQFVPRAEKARLLQQYRLHKHLVLVPFVPETDGDQGRLSNSGVEGVGGVPDTGELFAGVG
jgi:hypothetical protein